MTDSLPVSSNQDGIHPELEKTVRRFQSSAWRRPIAAHTLEAFSSLDVWVQQRHAPVILDIGCGTAHSSEWLAQQYPHHVVIGMDQSAHRLQKAFNRIQFMPENLRLVRADVQDFWRLVAERKWDVSHQYLWYPNPWPLAHHLKRRWYAHPVFPWLVAVGGTLELRTNWGLYQQEFALALMCYGIDVQCQQIHPEMALTAHEKKYLQSGHALYQMQCQLKGSFCGKLINQEALL